MFRFPGHPARKSARRTATLCEWAAPSTAPRATRPGRGRNPLGAVGPPPARRQLGWCGPGAGRPRNSPHRHRHRCTGPVRGPRRPISRNETESGAKVSKRRWLVPREPLAGRGGAGRPQCGHHHGYGVRIRMSLWRRGDARRARTGPGGWQAWPGLA